MVTHISSDQRRTSKFLRGPLRSASQPHIIKRILAETLLVPVATRRYPPYLRIAESDARRQAVVSLHSECWQKTSIAVPLLCLSAADGTKARRWPSPLQTRRNARRQYSRSNPNG